MSALVRDLRYALRRLRRSPGFTAVAVATLALGIGATTAMFGVVDAVLLRSLPYPEANRLARVYPASPERGIERGALSPLDFDDWRALSTTFEALGAYWTGTMNLSGLGQPEVLRTTYASDGFFGTLQTGARLGRTLTADDIADGRPVVVLSDALWQRRFAGETSAIGAPLNLDGIPHTVVGVMPPEFRFPASDVDLWAPVSRITEDMIPRARGVRWLSVVGRLASDVALEPARAEMDAIASRLAVQHPGSNAGWNRVTVVDLREDIVGSVAPALLVAFAAVGFVLLLVAANLANLLVAKAVGRQREMAIRSALGAGRSRIARQLLTETLVLSGIGGILGAALAVLALGPIRALVTPILPRTEEIGLDVSVFVVAFAASLATGVLFGTAPAFRAARSGLRANLADAGVGGLAGRRQRLRAGIVVGQVALAVLLTVGAGLMVRNFHLLGRVDPGFEPEGVLAAQLQLPFSSAASGAEGDDAIDFLSVRKTEILERLAAIPGTQGVASVNVLPLAQGGEEVPLTDERGPVAGESERWAEARFTSGEYLRVMGIRLLAGESLPDSPSPDAAPTVVVSEATARYLWPGASPLGRTLHLGTVPMEVVGLAADVRSAGLSEEPPLTVYMHQNRAPRVGVTFVVRTDGDPTRLASVVRDAIWDVDPEQPIGSVFPLAELRSEALARDRFFTLLLGAFGALGLLVAALGLYGVLALDVGRRTREIGVRMALGARPDNVLKLVVGRAAVLVGAGIALGLAAAMAATRVMSGMLHMVSTTDPATFVAVPVLLALVAIVAAITPARRAARVDPIVALRSE